MATATPTYSTLFACLHDEARHAASCLPAYSVFRAVDSRDVTRSPTARPRVHDFIVIWDDDHDTRIIAVIEEMLMAGILPGVQFISEHKGTLSIILASPTYWADDLQEFKAQVSKLSAAAGDSWVVEVGMIDTTPGNMKVLHQCEFLEILGNSDADIAFFFLMDTAWQLGTKVYPSIDLPPPPPPKSVFFYRDRYLMSPSPNRHSMGPSFPPSPFPPSPIPR